MQGYAVLNDLLVFYENAFLLTVVLIMILRRSALQFGLIDTPTKRKLHQGNVPLVGGLAMFIAFVLATTPPYGMVSVPFTLLGGMTILVVLGTLDDLRNLNPIVKILVQLLASILMIVPGGMLIEDLGNLFGWREIHLALTWSVPLTILWFVGVINAVNMFDGLDGLAGGMSLIAILWFSVAAATIGAEARLIQMMYLAAVVLGFLLFNMRHRWRSRASVFMGDAGSMMLGFALAWLAVDLSQHGRSNERPAIALVAVLWILALPVIDTVSLLIRRSLAGRNPLSADRNHLHHLLQDSGFSVKETVFILLMICAVLGAIGLWGWYIRVPDYILLALLIVPIALHTFFVCYGWKLVKSSRHRVSAETNAGAMPGGAEPAVAEVAAK